MPDHVDGIISVIVRGYGCDCERCPGSAWEADRRLACHGRALQGDDVDDDFFLAIIAAHNELEFDEPERAPPGLSGGCMMQVILPEFVDYS